MPGVEGRLHKASSYLTLSADHDIWWHLRLGQAKWFIQGYTAGPCRQEASDSRVYAPKISFDKLMYPKYQSKIFLQMSYINGSSSIAKVPKLNLEALIMLCLCLRLCFPVLPPSPQLSDTQWRHRFQREDFAFHRGRERTLDLAAFQQHKYFPEE